MKSENLTIWNEGTTQKQRTIQSLTNPSFRVDEREFEDLLNEVIEYSSYVSFHKPENIDSDQPRHTWKHFLEIDEVSVLSQLKLFNLKKIEDDFYSHYNLGWKASTRLARKHLHLALFVSIDLGRNLIRWHDLLSRIPSHQPHYLIFKEWEQALHQIPSFQISGISQDKAEIEDDRSANLKQIIWHLLAWERSAKERGKASLEKFPFEPREELERYFRILQKTTLFLASKYPFFKKLSEQNHAHEPHNGLLFGFLELFKNAQEKINGFHTRHLDFYYKELLGLKPTNASPDETIILPRLEDSIKTFKLNQGVKFLGGTDHNGDEVLYESLDDLLIDQSTIKYIRGIHLHRRQIGVNTVTESILSREYELTESEEPWPIMEIAVGNPKSIRLADIGFAITSPNLELRDGNRRITFTFNGLTEFYALNTNIIEKLKGQVKENQDIEKLDATLAEVIKAASLKLGSDLTIKTFFQVVFSPSIQQSEYSITGEFYDSVMNTDLSSWLIGKSGDPFSGEMLLSELILELEEHTQRKHDETLLETMESMFKLGTANSGKEHRKFRRLFLDAFEISYSSTEGWEYLKPVSVEMDTNSFAYSFRIVIVLNQDRPAVLANSTLGFEDPVIRFLINKEAPTYPYDFLNRINPYQIDCDVEVADIKDLTVYNQIGQLNPDGPFFPFGPTPNNFSYLLIGNSEVFKKKIHRLKVNLDWMDLPILRGGFKAHYAEYNETFHNDEFKMEVSLLSSGEWKPESDKRQEINIFGNEEFLKNDLSYELDTRKLESNEKFDWNPEELVFDKLTRRGFIKLQLSAPTYSFGHSIYPNLLSQMVMKNASKLSGLKSLISGKGIQMPMPNLPYTPKLAHISLDYSLKFKIDFRSKKGGSQSVNKFYHLEPFGGQSRVYGTGRSANLVPSFTDEGSLLLAIDQSDTPCVVTLFFHLMEREAGSDTLKEDAVEWSVLVDNSWKRLTNDQVSLDTTNGLIQSGIVRLDIPYIRRFENTLLESKLLWIKASLKRGINILGNVISIQNHAVRVRRIMNGNVNNDRPFIPARTIESAYDDLPQLREVSQPMASYNGRPNELENDFKIRVSERLRHRNRMVNQYDYERIILEAFPSVNKVLCLNAFRLDSSTSVGYSINKPGNVLLVMVPLISVQSGINPQAPKNGINTLRKVRQLLQSRSSAFASFQVINPAYEPVRVFAKVKLKSGSDGTHIKKLNQELKELIAPWIGDPSQEPMFQKKLALEEVQSFIQSRPYIDFVTKISMVKVHETKEDQDNGPYRLDDTGISKTRDNEIKGRYPWSILTTASRHSLEFLNGEDILEADEAGLDELYLNEDFVIPQTDT